MIADSATSTDTPPCRQGLPSAIDRSADRGRLQLTVPRASTDMFSFLCQSETGSSALAMVASIAHLNPRQSTAFRRIRNSCRNSIPDSLSVTNCCGKRACIKLVRLQDFDGHVQVHLRASRVKLHPEIFFRPLGLSMYHAHKYVNCLSGQVVLGFLIPGLSAQCPLTAISFLLEAAS